MRLELLRSTRVEKPWRSTAPILEQLQGNTGEGYLRTLTTTTELEPIFTAEIAGRFSRKDVKRLQGAYEMMAEFHAGQTRRSGGEFGVHPARVAIRDAQDPQTTLVQLTIDLVHDVVEDCNGVGPKDVRDLLRMRDYSEQDASDVALGTYALSRKVHGIVLSPEAYKANILHIHGIAPQLEVPQRKCGDSTDNTLEDLGWLLNDPTKVDPARIQKFLTGKAAATLQMGINDNPHGRNTLLLKNVMELCAKQLSHPSGGTIFTTA